MNDLDLKKVRERFLKLAQKYHPDADSPNKNNNLLKDDKFITVKESFDRLL